MSLNRLLTDFIVKKATLKIKAGNQWKSPTSPALVGAQYRLEVITGNANGMINWGDEGDYNKVLLQIRVVTHGFKINNSYVQKYKVEFYTDSTFSAKVHTDSKKNYRTSFELPEYKTTSADTVTYLYLMFEPGVPQVSLRYLRWNFGIYGAVRNHHWKQQNSRLS